MRQFSLADIECLGLGATALGAGGGGETWVAELAVRDAIEHHGPVTVVEAGDLAPDDLVLPLGLIGTPTASSEKLPGGVEFSHAIDALTGYLNRTPAAVMALEIGGLNALFPLAVAARLGLPVVDADTMGRAFPRLEMTVLTLAGVPATPLSIADEKGNVVVLEALDHETTERVARAVVTEFGLIAAICCYPLRADQVVAHALLGSISGCLDLGRQLMAHARGEAGALETLLARTGGRRLFVGKVLDIERRSIDGTSRGSIVLEHLDLPDRTLRIEMQTELLLALEDGEVLAATPDLIVALDHEAGLPVTVEELAFGQRLDVLSLPCPPRWRTPDATALVGPAAFGYDIAATAVGRAG